MQTTLMSPEKVFQHHLTAIVNNDLEELMKDYTEESELWTPDGPIVGLKAISSFFAYALTLFPKDQTKFEIKKLIVKNDKVYMIWTAVSPVVNISFATDSFEIQEGNILWQSTAFQKA
jgi:hypothetical protein